MTDKLVGQQIGGYLIEQHLAEGGMGSVYLCRRPGSQEALAIKIMLPEHTEDGEYRERFEREAKTMQALRHPHIMPVQAWGEENGVLYLVMPYVRGPSVFDLLGRRRFSPLTAWQILNPVAQALEYAHGRGIIHRDIKPGNMLVEARSDTGNHLYLVDFGLSKVAGMKTLTRSGVSLGTPYYMSPEQVLAKRISPQTDLYSLGVVLYELLLGRLPYTGDKAYDIALNHVREPVPLPHTLRPDFPRPLEPVLLRALAKDPRDRFRSAEEFRLEYAQAVQAIEPEARKIEYWVQPAQ
ncbi:MAG TPA: serine/threonine-protein kinase [Aggregatilineales bacterium]|nr:serine/threonine-protein kinase [Aggregatilineales bacterium]